MTASSKTVSWRTRASSPVVVLLLAASVASCGAGASRDDAGSGARRLRPAAHVLQRPARVQRERFALLRTTAEGLPPSVRGLVRAKDATFNPALAQRIPVLLPGSYWLAPAAGALCIVSQIPGTPGVGTVCGSTRQVLAEGIATISFVPPGRAAPGAPTRLVVGVAPDDARAALVHTRGAVTRVPVVRGVFVLRDAQRVPSEFIALRRVR